MKADAIGPDLVADEQRDRRNGTAHKGGQRGEIRPRTVVFVDGAGAGHESLGIGDSI
jgi:hypothetical protein